MTTLKPRSLRLEADPTIAANRLGRLMAIIIIFDIKKVTKVYYTL